MAGSQLDQILENAIKRKNPDAIFTMAKMLALGKLPESVVKTIQEAAKSERGAEAILSRAKGFDPAALAALEANVPVRDTGLTAQQPPAEPKKKAKGKTKGEKRIVQLPLDCVCQICRAPIRSPQEGGNMGSTGHVCWRHKDCHAAERRLSEIGRAHV